MSLASLNLGLLSQLSIPSRGFPRPATPPSPSLLPRNVETNNTGKVSREWKEEEAEKVPTRFSSKNCEWEERWGRKSPGIANHFPFLYFWRIPHPLPSRDRCLFFSLLIVFWDWQQFFEGILNLDSMEIRNQNRDFNSTPFLVSVKEEFNISLSLFCCFGKVSGGEFDPLIFSKSARKRDKRTN